MGSSSLMADFFIFRMANVPANLEDQLTEICFSFGAEGVSQDLAFTQPNLEYQSEVLAEDFITLNVYFLNTPSFEFTERVRSLVPSAQIEVNSETNRDWLSEWKKHFFPFELTDGVWVVPSWLTAPPEARQILAIDPGMAFGTGHHATTRLSAKLLAKALKQQEVNQVLDVGTGTGVLGLLANKLGVKSVVGIDNDPEALRVARENMKLNHSSVQIWNDDIAQIDTAFDIVIANIIDSVLLRLKPHLLRVSAQTLIVSGVLHEREQLFVEEFLNQSGLTLMERLSEDDWCAFWFRKE